MALNSEDPRIGEHIREYRLEKCLASGGMGTIFLAQRSPESASERSILRVFKLLRHELAADRQGLLLFQREVKILQKLHHPNIVQLEDHGIHETLGRYICMEYITGHTLKTHLRRTPHPFGHAQILRWIQQICEALYYSHERHIIHRDLKPENIFLQSPDTPAETLKLFDFGIAFCPDIEEIPARHVGTPRYMPPEQIRNERVDGRADLYSLGIILFELLTQRSVFSEQNSDKLREAHLHQFPPSLQDKRPDLEIPPAVEQLFQRLLAKSPTDRPNHARAFYEAVKSVLPPSPFAKREGRLGIVVGASADQQGLFDENAATPPPTLGTTQQSPHTNVSSPPPQTPIAPDTELQEDDGDLWPSSPWKAYLWPILFLCLALLSLFLVLTYLRK